MVKVLVLVCGIALAFYVGVWVLFIGGLVQLIEAVKATPVESYGLAVGIAKTLLATPIGWGIGIITLLFVR